MLGFNNNNLQKWYGPLLSGLYTIDEIKPLVKLQKEMIAYRNVKHSNNVKYCPP